MSIKNNYKKTGFIRKEKRVILDVYLLKKCEIMEHDIA